MYQGFDDIVADALLVQSDHFIIAQSEGRARIGDVGINEILTHPALRQRYHALQRRRKVRRSGLRTQAIGIATCPTDHSAGDRNSDPARNLSQMFDIHTLSRLSNLFHEASFSCSRLHLPIRGGVRNLAPNLPARRKCAAGAQAKEAAALPRHNQLAQAAIGWDGRTESCSPAPAPADTGGKNSAAHRFGNIRVGRR